MARPFEPFFRDYAKAFDAFDAEQIAAYYHCPCLMVSSEHVASFTTEDAIRENMSALLDHHRAQNVGRAEVSDLRVELLAEDLAIVRVRWCIRDREDAPLWSWLNTYNLVDSGYDQNHDPNPNPNPNRDPDHGSGWKILVSTTHAERTDGGVANDPR